MRNPNEKLNLLQKVVVGMVIAFILLVFYGSYLDYLWIKRHLKPEPTKADEIQKLKDQIENLYSINKWQESQLRDCGFYGDESHESEGTFIQDPKFQAYASIMCKPGY